MLRIILPLAFVATLLFAPFYNIESQDNIRGEITSSTRTASNAYFEESVDCAKAMEFNPMTEGCTPADFTGWAFYSAAATSVIAGVLGIIGLLPFIGRLTSAVTTGAGGIGTGTMGLFFFDLWQKGGLNQVEWGGWLAGGLALLTLISGFLGMRGDRD